MGFTQLLTDLGTGLVDFMETVFPGMAGTVVKTFDALAFSGSGDTTTISAAFGWLVAGGLVFLGVGLFRRLWKKITR